MSTDKWKQIEALDLDTVKDKLKSRKSWWWNLWNNVDRIEAEYRQFLYLIALNPGETVVPWTQKLDDFWHEHILDTMKYENDCKALFGRIIHHNPHLPQGSSKQQTAYKNTKKMYREAFGEKAKSKGSSRDDAAGCGGGFIAVFCSSSSCGGGSDGGSSCSSSSCGSSCGGGCGSGCGGGCGGGCGS